MADPEQRGLMSLVSCLCGFTWVHGYCLLSEPMAIAAKTLPPHLLVPLPAVPLPSREVFFAGNPTHLSRPSLRPTASAESVQVSGNNEWLPLLYSCSFHDYNNYYRNHHTTS